MCVIGTVEVEVRSSSVSVLYVVRLHMVFSKAALQKRGSMEPMEPSLDLPLYIGPWYAYTYKKVFFTKCVCNCLPIVQLLCKCKGQQPMEYI